MDNIKKIDGGITAAKGFKAACTAAGIKYRDRVDMAMVYSEKPCCTAGTFTKNVVKAAPVLWDKKVVSSSEFGQAVVINAGIANACTGDEGFECCEKTAEAAEKYLKIPKESVLVASTGVIGFKMPVDKVVAGVKDMSGRLSHEKKAGTDASKAIMTTDTHNKEIAFEIKLSGKTAHIGGMCKGSGMIHPNMGTMLAFITTDAAIEKKLLQESLKKIVGNTFNMVSVDGDTSTNDTLIVLANGMAGTPEIREKNEDFKVFYEALRKICVYLSISIASDGEGATKLFTAHVIGAKNLGDARTLANSVIQSSLSKAAIFGSDANWGRFLCALGYSGVEFDPYKVDIYVAAGNVEKSKLEETDMSYCYPEKKKSGKKTGDKKSAGEKRSYLQLVSNGKAADYSEEDAKKIFSADEVIVTADMKMGSREAVAHGCDLSYDYVKINADYRS